MFVYALGTQDVQLVRDLLTKEGVPKVQSARLEEVVDHVWEEWWISLDKLMFWKKMGLGQYLLYNTIISGMNIHLPAILMFTRGTRFWHTVKWF